MSGKKLDPCFKPLFEAGISWHEANFAGLKRSIFAYVNERSGFIIQNIIQKVNDNALERRQSLVCVYTSSANPPSSLWAPITHGRVLLALPVNVVQSLSAYPVNSTCVILLWTLSPQIYVITSFVIEWKNLNNEEEMKWVRVPPNTSKYYIYGEWKYNAVCYFVQKQRNMVFPNSWLPLSPPLCF